MTKLNKSAEILFNRTAANAVGKTISDLLGTSNSHFMSAVAEVVGKAPFSSMLKSQIKVKRGAQEAGAQSEQTINVNFYVSKLSDSQRKSFGYCLVFQPII